MKNFLIAVIVIALGAFGLQQFLPWWIIAIVAFIVGYLVQQSSWGAFAAGFTAIFVLWVVYAFILSQANHHILAHKVAQLLTFSGHVWLLLLVTGIIGGLVGGLASLSGRLAANLRA